MKLNFFADAYMVRKNPNDPESPYLTREEIADKNYNFLVDVIRSYIEVFENNSADVNSILQMPYPLFSDILIKQYNELKKRAQKIHQENLLNDSRNKRWR